MMSTTTMRETQKRARIKKSSFISLAFALRMDVVIIADFLCVIFLVKCAIAHVEHYRSLS